MQTDTIYEYAAYADDWLVTPQECGPASLRVQGGADGADAIAREWVLHNKENGSQVELITDPTISSPAASESRERILWQLGLAATFSPHRPSTTSAISSRVPLASIRRASETVPLLTFRSLAAVL